MMTNNKTFLSFAFVILLAACKKDDPPLAPNEINFETKEQGIAAGVNEVEMKISLSRPAEVNIPVTVDLVPSGVTYGTEFTTSPEATSNQLNLAIPAGASSTTFKVNKKTGSFLSGTESIAFIIKSVAASAIKGSNDTSTIKFSSIVSSGASLTLGGKTTTSAYANVVYVDFSNNQATAVDRKSWNLGFYNGSDFRVILNSSYQSTVKALNKTDLAAVTIADTTGVYLDHDITDPTTVSMVDYWDGDLKKTAISEIAANENDNKVYLLSFEGSKKQDQYYKLKITRNGTGYRLKYARVGDSDIKTLDVPKGTEANFQFASVETGKLVGAEPKKLAWDIAWCYGTFNSGLGSPYWFQDFIMSNNLAGTAVAEVLETQVSYDAFAESNIAGVNFLTTRDAIGSKWRQGGGPTVSGTIKRDRYYVVKDPGGNVYKLKFISWGGGGDAGERGRPVIEYKLVKNA